VSGQAVKRLKETEARIHGELALEAEAIKRPLPEYEKRVSWLLLPRWEEAL
jgi:hypothetical protein